MIPRCKCDKKKGMEEQLVQKFPHRCPYCDQLIPYDRFDLKMGENQIRCPSCKSVYIKMVSDPIGSDLARKTSLPRREGRKGRGK